MQGSANRNCGEHQTEQATSHAQQESFHQGFADDSAGTRANRNANRIFAPLTDGRTKSRLETFTQAINNTMATARNNICNTGRTSATTVSRSGLTSLESESPTCLREIADIGAPLVGILSGLRQGHSILQPGDHVVAPKAEC